MVNLINLPSEILSLIMDQLDERRDIYNCTKVHSYLYAAANQVLWNTIHLRHQASGLRFLYCLIKVKRPVGEMIHHVHLENFHWNDKALNILMKRTPHLISLVLDNATRITDTHLQHINDYWLHLESLHITSSPITHLSYHALGQLPKLTNLELWNCRGLQPNTFSICFVDSPLKKLMLAIWVDENDENEDTPDVDPWVVSTTTNERRIDLTTLRQLSHLKLHGSPFDMLHQNGHSWPHMTSVDFEACFDMMDDVAIYLVRELPSGLTHLAMKDGHFTNVTLDAIMAYQPNLTELDVSSNNQLTPRGIRRLVRHCSQLSLVKLAYCGMVMEDFPEAGPECSGTIVTFDTMRTGLAYLNQKAIRRIRHGSDIGNQNK